MNYVQNHITAPLFTFPFFPLHPALSFLFPRAFLYAERDLSSLVLVNGFRAHAGAANPASVYSRKIKTGLGRGRD